MSESLHAPIGARVIGPEGWASGWTRSLRQGGGGTGEPATFKVLIGTIFGIPKGRDAVAASLTKRIGGIAFVGLNVSRILRVEGADVESSGRS